MLVKVGIRLEIQVLHQHLQITNRLFMGLYVLHLVVQHNVYDLLFRCCTSLYIQGFSDYFVYDL